MTYAQFRCTPLVPLDVLTRLIDMGLGEVPQERITEAQYERAMDGLRIARQRRGMTHAQAARLSSHGRGTPREMTFRNAPALH